MTGDAAGLRVVHRVVFPADKDLDVLPLYVDQGLPPQPDVARKGSPVVVVQQAPVGWHPDDVLSRESIRVRAGDRLSFASYFGAFPAAYWRRWTSVENVHLTVSTRGAGTVIVYKSNALGLSQRVESRQVSGSETNTWSLTLAPFGDGGWYWFDLIADHEGLVLEGAHYAVPDTRPVGRLTLGTTTFNRADYCVKTIDAISQDAQLMEILDEFVVVDQGTQRVREREEYPELQERFGSRLTVIEQANLGGSGGFSRNMTRALETGTDYLLLMDDDILVETEGILRAVAFADFCLTPTLVGGHMFDLEARSVLHAWAEDVKQFTYEWGSAEGLEYRHDFAQKGLRQVPELHKRWDPGYNGWWMCLIPRVVIEEIGLSLPVFIKWDDVEYGLRARAHGYPTVTLPGSAVWHLSWMGKDDTIDWQAYFHVRNRLVTALLHSPFERGGAVVLRCLAMEVKHIFGMQRYATRARLDAVRDVLSGPDHMHATLESRAAQLRAAKSDFPEATPKPRPQDFPAPGKSSARLKPTGPKQPSWAQLPLWLLKTSYRQFFKAVDPESKIRPEEILSKQDATWWRLAAVDSALVSTADGTGFSWHVRDTAKARKNIKEAIALYAEVYRRWDELQELYRAEAPRFTSLEQWMSTFARTSGSSASGADAS